MKIILLFATLFLFSNVYCQNLEKVKKLDTIYIPYKNKSYEGKKAFNYIKENNDIVSQVYFDYFIKSKKMTNKNPFIIHFTHMNINQNGNVLQNKMSNVIYLEKREIDKKKIIKPKAFSNIEMCKINFNIFESEIVFFIIDYTEKSADGKLKLYEVRPSPLCQRDE